MTAAARPTAGVVPAWLVAGVVLAVLWVFVWGMPLTEPDRLLGGFLVGLVVGLPVAFVFRRLFPPRADLRHLARAVPYGILYVLLLVREIVVANLDVAYRVVAPGPPLDPEVMLVPLRVERPMGITAIASSITLTPGTVTLGHDRRLNALYVHTIDGRDVAEIVAPIRRWERYALVIFDEAADPADPPPEIAIDRADLDRILEEAEGDVIDGGSVVAGGSVVDDRDGDPESSDGSESTPEDDRDGAEDDGRFDGGDGSDGDSSDGGDGDGR